MGSALQPQSPHSRPNLFLPHFCDVAFRTAASRPDRCGAGSICCGSRRLRPNPQCQHAPSPHSTPHPSARPCPTPRSTPRPTPGGSAAASVQRAVILRRRPLSVYLELFLCRRCHSRPCLLPAASRTYSTSNGFYRPCFWCHPLACCCGGVPFSFRRHSCNRSPRDCSCCNAKRCSPYSRQSAGGNSSHQHLPAWSCRCSVRWSIGWSLRCLLFYRCCWWCALGGCCMGGSRCPAGGARG